MQRRRLESERPPNQPLDGPAAGEAKNRIGSAQLDTALLRSAQGDALAEGPGFKADIERRRLYVALTRASPRLLGAPGLGQLVERLVVQLGQAVEERAGMLGVDVHPEVDIAASSLNINFVPTNQRFSVPLADFVTREAMTPYGDPYVRRTPVPFEQVSDVERVIGGAIDELRRGTVNIANRQRAFGWAHGGPEGVQPPGGYRIPGVDTLRRVVERPSESMLFYRGLRSPDVAGTIAAVLRDGLLPRHCDMARLEAVMTDFIARDDDGRERLLARQSLERRIGARSFLVGGSTDFASAAVFGPDLVVEARVPLEAVLFAPRRGPYETEQEDYVPFAIHPEWITRVLARDGRVLAERSGPPSADSAGR